AALALWGAVLVGGAVAVYPRGHGRAHARAALGRQAVAAVLAIFGVLQLVGAASGGTDPLQPLSHLAGPPHASATPAPAFSPVRSVADLDAALAAAPQAGR